MFLRIQVPKIPVFSRSTIHFGVRVSIYQVGQVPRSRIFSVKRDQTRMKYMLDKWRECKLILIETGLSSRFNNNTGHWNGSGFSFIYVSNIMKTPLWSLCMIEEPVWVTQKSIMRTFSRVAPILPLLRLFEAACLFE